MKCTGTLTQAYAYVCADKAFGHALSTAKVQLCIVLFPQLFLPLCMRTCSSLPVLYMQVGCSPVGVATCT